MDTYHTNPFKKTPSMRKGNTDAIEKFKDVFMDAFMSDQCKLKKFEPNYRK